MMRKRSSPFPVSTEFASNISLRESKVCLNFDEERGV